MNETIVLGGNGWIIAASLLLSLILGGLHRLMRNVSRERREVNRALLEMRELEERCDLQQVHVARLGRQVEALSRRARAPAVAEPAREDAREASSRRVRSAEPPERRADRAAPRSEARRPATPDVKRPANPFELARAGAGIGVVMGRCGLSRAEAELVVSVHGRSRG